MCTTVGRVAGFLLVLAAASTLAIAPAAAKPVKQRSATASASASVQDVSGLQVTRAWKIAAGDPGTLVATVHLQNTNTAPVTTTILEPMPTDSLKKVEFKPKKVKVTPTPGVARVDVTIPSGGELDYTYTALLIKDRKANAQDRLATVQGEMEATLATAQPSDPDKAIAAMKDRYVGRMKVTEETADGVTIDVPILGREFSTSVRLTTTPFCRVVSRGCRFPATDGFTDEPKLTGFEPAGNSLVSDASADLAESGLTCGGADTPGLQVNHWTFEPTNWKLTWSGWEVSQGTYTIVGDTTSPPTGRCVYGAYHAVLTGLLSG
jgi:hypothetical protein